jgi:hypothetical protein
VVSEVTLTGVPGDGTATFPSDRGWREGESAISEIQSQAAAVTTDNHKATTGHARPLRRKNGTDLFHQELLDVGWIVFTRQNKSHAAGNRQHCGLNFAPVNQSPQALPAFNFGEPRQMAVPEHRSPIDILWDRIAEWRPRPCIARPIDVRCFDIDFAVNQLNSP